MFHYSEACLEGGMKMEREKRQELLKRSMKRGIERGREMDRERTQELLKHEREQTILEKEKHRLENEKFERKLQKIAIALHRDSLSTEQIASYMAADTNEIVTLLEITKQME
jgi:adenine-specific DNA methylase